MLLDDLDAEETKGRDQIKFYDKIMSTNRKFNKRPKGLHIVHNHVQCTTIFVNGLATGLLGFLCTPTNTIVVEEAAFLLPAEILNSEGVGLVAHAAIFQLYMYMRRHIHCTCAGGLQKKMNLKIVGLPTP